MCHVVSQVSSAQRQRKTARRERMVQDAIDGMLQVAMDGVGEEVLYNNNRLQAEQDQAFALPIPGQVLNPPQRQWAQS